MCYCVHATMVCYALHVYCREYCVYVCYYYSRESTAHVSTALHAWMDGCTEYDTQYEMEWDVYRVTEYGSTSIPTISTTVCM